MAQVLGIDLGTNSIGWGIIDPHASNNQIVATGVHVFTEGIVSEGGPEQSPAAIRTAFRSARRRYHRRRQRKGLVLRELIRAGMCPLAEEELRRWTRYQKGQAASYPTSTEFRRWLALDFSHQGCRACRNPYELRAKAVSTTLSPYELGRVFYHLVQRRGFRSNRKHADVPPEKDASAIKQQMASLHQLCGQGQTLGQIFAATDPHVQRIRGRYIDRKDYEAEFHLICDKQNVAPELRDKLYHAIYWQNPLKSQRVNVGRCVFEKKKPRCPLSAPIFEEFRAWQFANSVRYKPAGAPDTSFVPLTDSLRALIVEQLLTHSSRKFSQLRKVVCRAVRPSAYDFNYPDGHIVMGSPTCEALRKFFGVHWRAFQAPYTDQRTGKQGIITIEDVWNVLASFDAPDKLRAFAANRLGWDSERAMAFSSLRLKDGYARLSRKAISKILPFLKQGHVYSLAVFLANIETIVGPAVWREHGSTIQQDIAHIFNTHDHELACIRVANRCISALRDAGAQASPDSISDAHIETACREEMGHTLWRAHHEDATDNLIIAAVRDLIRTQCTRASLSFLKPPRLDQRIKEYLKNYVASERLLDQLYHPSQIDTYPPAPANKHGCKYLGSPRTASVKNPVVMRALHELRTLVNALLRKGLVTPNDTIHIEFARDLNDRNRRQAIQNYQRERQKQNQDYATELAALVEQETGSRISPSSTDILKYRLWLEQDKRCIYTGRTIGICELLDGNTIDLEHTIPRSRLLDNSEENLSVCDSTYNRTVKSNRLPTELPNYDRDAAGYTAILPRLQCYETKHAEFHARAEKALLQARMASTKEDKDAALRKKHYFALHRQYWRRKIEHFKLTDIPQRFKHSQLTDTSHIIRTARAYLNTVFDRVFCVKGRLTAEFRKLWQLQGLFEEKDRTSHLHHAIDALVIACVSRTTYDLLAQYYRDEERGIKPQLPLPWPSFATDVQAAVQTILVTYHHPDYTTKQTKRKIRRCGKTFLAQGKGIRGALHQGTFLGAVKPPACDEVRYVVRKPISALTPAFAAQIVDPAIRQLIQQRQLADVIRDGFVAFPHQPQRRITRVRCFVSASNPPAIKPHSHPSRVNHKRFYRATNECIIATCVYQAEYKSKIFLTHRTISLLDVARNTLPPSEFTERGRLYKRLRVLERNQHVLFYLESPEELYALPQQRLWPRLYRITQLETDGVRVKLSFHQNPLTDAPESSLWDHANPAPRLRLSLARLTCLYEREHFLISPLGSITFTS